MIKTVKPSVKPTATKTVKPTVKPSATKTVKPSGTMIKPDNISKLSKKGLALYLHKHSNVLEDYRTLKTYSKSTLVSIALSAKFR